MLVDASEILPVEPNTSTTNDDSSVPAGGTNEGLQSILRYGSDHQDRCVSTLQASLPVGKPMLTPRPFLSYGARPSFANLLGR